MTDTYLHEHQSATMNMASFPAAGEPRSSEGKMNMSTKSHVQHEVQKRKKKAYSICTQSTGLHIEKVAPLDHKGN